MLILSQAYTIHGYILPIKKHRFFYLCPYLSLHYFSIFIALWSMTSSVNFISFTEWFDGVCALKHVNYQWFFSYFIYILSIKNVLHFIKQHFSNDRWNIKYIFLLKNDIDLLYLLQKIRCENVCIFRSNWRTKLLKTLTRAIFSQFISSLLM